MPITYNAEKQLFTLQTANTTMSFGVFDHGYLFSHYYGKKVKNADLSQLWQPGASGFTPNYDGAPDGSHALDVIPTEYPSYGGGDFREPASLKTAAAFWILCIRATQSKRAAKNRTVFPDCPTATRRSK